MLDYVIIEARRQPQNEVVLTKRIARNQQISVGRTDSADLVLNDDPEISSIHFLIAVGDEQCTVTDRGSTNKTWYNGQPITQISIGDGERILCGKTEFTFRLVAAIDDPFSANLFSRDQTRADSGKETTTTRDSEKEINPRADRSTGVKSDTPPAPGQSQQRKPFPRAVEEPLKDKPTPPVVRSTDDPGSAQSTESEDMINWNLFAEDEPVTGIIAEADVPGSKGPRQKKMEPSFPSPTVDDGWKSGDIDSAAEKTRILDNLTPAATIVRVVIDIAGKSDDTIRAVIDPEQRPKVVIGRAASSHLPCPPDPYMSNQHFAIEIEDNRCTIRDLETSNGTWLNGQPILLAPLRNGDRVRAGKTDFEITVVSAP